ncbi:putative PurR-regulated permease PerM [Oikeobacillus pervagus]|uniref:PurR-regulated permease PerM n=1 Tax=Oikeobacillus pervagus TaxID=1325931 RepID=A0AAJ1T186_9BACI|nr:AI-2E family transporter [Oikeobacillus pervagus]MDQ0215322.1 putative PurR-regulated permease PerM [Oikeobacillus pervagus]
MTKKRWFQLGVAIIFLLIIIKLFREINDLLHPLLVLIQTIFLPLLVSGVLFYICRPIVKKLESWKIPRSPAILLVFLLLISFLWILITIIGPVLEKQFLRLVKNIPAMAETIESGVNYIIANRERLPDFAMESIQNFASNFENIAVSLGSWAFSFVQSLFGVVFILILVPFFLFYMLKDREKFVPFIAKFFSEKNRPWVKNTLKDIDYTLTAYIQGQLFVSFCVGVMLYIGYLIIDLDYSLILAFFGMLTNVIPFLGPYLAVTPAIFVAWIQEPQMVLYVAIVMLVAQQIESNLISPNVMGKALNIHPLTVISLILAAGNIAGIWGIILAIPTYAVAKTVIINIYKLRNKIKEAAVKEV